MSGVGDERQEVREPYVPGVGIPLRTSVLVTAGAGEFCFEDLSYVL